MTETDTGSKTADSKNGVMTSEGGIDRRGKDPELRDIDHDEHDQTRLPHRRLTDALIGGLRDVEFCVSISKSACMLPASKRFCRWPKLVRLASQLR